MMVSENKRKFANGQRNFGGECSMKDQLKWVLNKMPKSDDKQLDVMSLSNVAKARFFHSSFPQYSITPLAQL